MNRIICDICGSEYPETSERCPICSYPRQGTEKIVAAAGEPVRTKVKGGRFSAKNVKKRRKAQRKAAEGSEGKDPNKPLLIVIALLLIAIVLVSLYIAVRFFRGRDAYTGTQKPQTTASAATSTTLPVETEPPTIPCAGIVMDYNVLDLEEPGQQVQLSLRLMPEDTTDAVVYVSGDPAVATVSETGLVTAVGPGQTNITITCGEASKSCMVVCWFQEETTAPPETTQPPETTEATKATQATKATEPPELTLDQSDVSFFQPGESFTLRVKLGDASVSRSKVTWSSSDPDVATVENGLVTAVNKGTVTITAEYQGKKASCIVRCQFKDTSWAASASDVTLGVGESFLLAVTNDSGEIADVIWTMSLDGVVSINGSSITGRAPGTVTLKATVDGVTVSCIVRVK